jgi:hypothetical protein
LLRWSDDGAATWSDSLALDVAEAPGRTVPALAVAGDGRVLASFLHPLADGDRAEVRIVEAGGGLEGPMLTVAATEAMPASSGDSMGLAPRPWGAFAVWVMSPDGSAFDLAGAVG